MSQKFNATQLKYAMAALMVLDHIPHIPGLVSPVWTAIFHALTRCVGVWFAYTAVEGFVHTRDLKRYNFRLFGWAIFMAVGNTLLNFLLAGKGLYIDNNIFLTLAVGVFLLSLAFPRGSVANLSPILRWLGVVLILLAGAFLTEGGLVILPFMLITYACRQKAVLRNSLYLLWALVLFSMSFTVYETWQMTLEMLLYNSDFLFISVLPFIYFYNGERGRNTAFNKYFFYVFYPAHLWLIGLIAYVVR